MHDISWLKTEFTDLANISALNSGGFKEVFSAEHPLEGHVVLKIVQRQSDESVRREILAPQQVQSPRVPRIYDTGQKGTPLGPCYWIREQRVLGSTVRELIRSGPLDTRRLLRLGLHSLEALASAEEVQIVHRDVKPENLMGDGNDDFWLLDFGIARHLTLDSQTSTGDVWGKCTPGYAPPEQFRNLKSNIDSRTDLFALGVTLYECATGSNPFRLGASNTLEILRRVEKQPLPPLTLGFGAANQFRDLVDAMTQKRYDHRPASAQEALTWMQEICAKENI